MATIENAWKKTDGPVVYHDGERTVELGDRVKVRGWFRWKLGTVNYVPGHSDAHDEMEHGGLYWVGIAYDRGTFTGVLVDPDTGRLLEKVVLEERGSLDGVVDVPPAPWE